MTKKLFLTSFLAVFAACPAFAYTINGNPADPSATLTASCSGDTIGNAPPGATVNYVAVYQADECPITLDKNGGSVDSVPNQLIAVYGAGAYLNRDGNSQPTDQMTTSANALTDYSVGGTSGALPVGPSVTVTYNLTGYGTHTLSEIGGLNGLSLSPTITKTGNLGFNGFWRAATGGTAGIDQFINTDGYITNAGIGVAEGIVANRDQTGAVTGCPTTTWFAHWNCMEAGVTPSLTGYTFNGWTENVSGVDEPVNDTCVSATATWDGSFTPNNYTVTYDCNGHSLVAGLTANQQGNFEESVTYDTPNYTWKTVANVCVAGNYTSTGWTCVDSGNNTVTPSDGIWTIASNVTCTAGWNNGDVTLVWDADDGTLPYGYDNPGSCSIGEDMGAVYQPTKTGYTFKGWAIEE